MRLRKWGFPVLRVSGGLPDPIQHLDDPDETPEPPNAPSTPPPVREDVDAETVQRLRDGLEAWDPDGPPVQVAGRGEPAPVVERLDVPPERRPWDDFEAPPRQPAPRPGVRIVKVPHCDGRHGPGHPTDIRGLDCDWCDALTSQISALKALERRITELEERVADLAKQVGQDGGAS